MRKISSVIMACAMCLSMTVVGTVAPKVAVQAEVTAEAEKKEAPATVPTVALDSDFFSGDTIYTLTYSVNEQNWIEAMTSVEVNNQVYTKVSYSWDMGSDKYQPSGSSYNIKIGKKAFTEDVNKVVISAEGYKDLVLEVNKDGKTVAIHTNQNHKGGTATCLKKAVCDFCGQEYGDLADHTYGETYESDGNYHWKKCDVCGQETEKEAHKGGTATTTKKAVCDVCGAEYGDLKKEEPKPADKTTESKNNTKPAATTTVKNNTKPAKKKQ